MSDERHCESLFMRRRRRGRQLGGAYITVLAASMIVMVIGVAALLAARVQRRAAATGQDQALARTYAVSALDLVMYRLVRDPAWRSRYANDTWSADAPIATGTYSFKLVDEADGDLANDPTQPVRLYASATAGKSTRLLSVLLDSQMDAGSSANLLSNGDMENGTASWFGAPVGDADLESRTELPHSGASYIVVKNRANAAAGPRQDVTGKITSGQSYDVEVYIRMQDSTENVRVVLKTTTVLLITNTTALTNWTSVGTQWTRVSGTATPTWLNLLSTGELYIETASTNQQFNVDDAILVPTGSAATQIKPVPGTWRQEVLP